MSRACWLLRLAGDAGLDVPALLGEMAGAEPDHAERLVRRSRLSRTHFSSPVASGVRAG